LLTPAQSAQRSRTLSTNQALSLEPSLAPGDLLGAGYYIDDLLLFPERLCLENVLSAHRLGARVFNYTQVEEILPLKNGLRELVVRDLLTREPSKLAGRLIINAAGPWVDQIRAMAGVEDRRGRLIRSTKGIHILLPRMTDHAIYLSAKDDRMLFVIPWREFSLVGTTDTDFEGDPDRCWATADEVGYLLGETRRALSDPRVSEDTIAYTYAGVRPLSWEAGKPASKVSRQHRMVSEGPRKEILSITGTKLTCYRSLAQHVGERVVAQLGRGGPSKTTRLALDGSDEEAGQLEARAWMDVGDEIGASGLTRDQLEYVVELYGRNYRAVLSLARALPDGAARLCDQNPDIVAQLHHAVAHELTCSLQDFLLRRSGIGQSACQGMDCAPGIAGRMATLLGWSARRLEAELSAYQDHVERNLRFRTRKIGTSRSEAQ
ncbi:MAG TPA: FAD-dependent oxidoreductase, partial [Methylomirabilota bacterium]|nr:FAD-dependent oxidoreductase [Methylomirabilota bacterium]